jgi:hypothetical protein
VAGIACNTIVKFLGLIGFEGDFVVTVVDHPSCELDVGSINRVSSVTIQIHPIVVVLKVGVVDVDVLQQDFARVNECHGPHLALEEFDSLNHGVSETIEGDLVWTARVIANRPVAFVSDLTIAVQGALSI